MKELKPTNEGVTFNIGPEAMKKVISLCLMLVMATFIYNTLKITKDSLVIPLLGAEIVSTLKLWAVLPFAILFILAYSKLANILSKEKLFYTITGFFILFFMSFSFIIYPIHENIHPDLSSIIENHPRFKWPLLMISNWSFALFYIMAELCGNVILTILFWQTANSLNSITEAKKYYGTFIFIGHIGHILSGVFVTSLIPAISHKFNKNSLDIWADELKVMAIIVSSAIITITIIYRWICNNIDETGKVSTEALDLAKKSKKQNMPLSQSLKVIFSSKYLGLIALMVICYGISINIVEGAWKSQVKIQYPDHASYNYFMGKFQIWAGSINMLIALVAAKFIQRQTWLTCAIITPLVIFVTGTLFFILIYMKSDLAGILAESASSIVFIAVIVGAAQNIFSKSVKYSLFDMTKEMAYIPLSEELKTKGKAAADLLGHKLGKSGGAFIQWLLLSLIPGSTLVGLAGYFFLIFIIIMSLWLWAVLSLNKKFLQLTENKEI